MLWSVSGHNIFRRCQRQYFFSQVMASPTSNDAMRREAYMLKQLQGLQAWKGSLVHQALHSWFVPALRNRQQISADELTERTIGLANGQLEFSQRQQYRLLKQQPKKYFGPGFAALFEHEYGLEVPEQEIQEVHAVISRCFQNLCASDGLLDLLRAHTSHMSERSLSFKIGDFTVRAKLDLLCLAKDRQTILDWKVSEDATSKHPRQGMVYALASMRAVPNVELANLEVYEFNLLANGLRLHNVTEEKLADTEDFIFRSATEIWSLICNHNSSIEALADYESARSPYTCQYCNFRKLCWELSHE